jgi:hypothetical protein
MPCFWSLAVFEENQEVALPTGDHSLLEDLVFSFF